MAQKDRFSHLHPARRAGGKVIGVVGHVNLEALPVDDVEVGLHADLQRAAVQQPDRVRRVAALHLDDVLEGHLRAASTVTRPIRTHVSL